MHKKHVLHMYLLHMYYTCIPDPASTQTEVIKKLLKLFNSEAFMNQL